VSSEKVNVAVNAALHLGRPLLLTGLPGSGKSTLVELISAELQLGKVLRWHVTSKSTLEDGLYGYDALGRLNASQVEGNGAANAVANFVTLGPLGTALADQARPRAVLIDEIDKSDLDLPGDLLDVLERGEFEIPPLVRDTGISDVGAASDQVATEEGEAVGVESGEVLQSSRIHRVRGSDGGRYTVADGKVAAHHLPVIVFTSNGERSFPPPFLRRCVRLDVDPFNVDELTEIVTKHFTAQIADTEQEEIRAFAARITAGDVLAVDQLLNLLHLFTGDERPDEQAREILRTILLTGLAS
jgi:MoxR-like ATPase